MVQDPPSSPSSKSPVAGLRQALASRPRRIILGFTVAGILALLSGTLYVFGIGGSPSQTPITSATVAPANGGTVFTIDPSGSQASFTIDEALFGQPNTVVGKTNAVAGQILVHLQDPSQSHIGQLKIDLSTLVTDNDFRNRALQNRILESDQAANQYATFDTTSLDGLPASVSIGQTVAFKITGKLTIHQVTRTETLDAQVTPASRTQLNGTAQTTITYSDFNITIPSVPSVTGVSERVKLALTFTAHAGG